MRLSLRRTPQIPCVEFVELVTDYFEGTLPDRDQRAFERHLTVCDGCTSYLEQMRETVRLTEHLTVDDVPDEGVAELMDAFRAYQLDRG